MAGVIQEHIEKTLDVCGGRARIVGHSIRVMDVVGWHYKRGFSLDEIVTMFPGITLADVHAAMTYYFDNRTEIESELQADEAMAEFAKTHYPSKLQERLRG